MLQDCQPPECLKGIVMPKDGQVRGLSLTRPVFSVFYYREPKGFIGCLRLAVTLLLWRQEMAFVVRG